MANKKEDISMKDLGKGFITIIFSLILLVGCFGSPKAPKEEENTAKTFLKDPNNSVIYIYRGWAQATRTFRLYLDDNLIGESNNNSFFRIVSQPGTHKLTLTNVRNVAFDTLSLSTEAGKVYYVEIKGNPIFASKLKLALIADQEAMQKIREYSLLKAGATAMRK
jgi:hypothetical protein